VHGPSLPQTRGRTPLRYAVAVIDLHTHSRFSDGSDSPVELAQRAARVGISAIALTDHDTTAGHADMAAACAVEGVELIIGVELSLKDPLFLRAEDSQSVPRSVHVLAYFVPVDPASPFQRTLATLRHHRLRRNESLVAALQAEGLERITLELVAREAGNYDNIGRPHVAAVMLREYPERFGPNTPENVAAIFREWLGTEGRTYIPRQTFTIDEFIQSARGSGVVFSVAHPLMNYLDSPNLAQIEKKLPPILQSLRERGVSGVEAYYGGFDLATRSLLVKVTRDAGMIPTGGSDYHGTYKSDVVLGHGFHRDNVVPDEVLDELKSLR
jgi:3',5'-nucleoside bisphosphate phosphatase